MCLVLFQYLLARKDVLNLSVHFSLLIAIENVVDCLKFIVDDQELTSLFWFFSVSPFVKNCDVALEQVEALEAEQGHVESQVRALLVDFVGVTWSHAAEDWEQIAVTGKIQVYFEIWNTF